MRVAVAMADRLRSHAQRCEADRPLALRLAANAPVLAILRRTPPMRVAAAPSHFHRFDPGERLWAEMARAVEAAVRAEQARFTQYAVMHSIVALTASQPRARQADLLSGWYADLDPTDILPVQASVYEAAGQNALSVLGIDAAFGIRNDTGLAARVAALFTDQLDGINATTRKQLAAVLERNAGEDADTIASAVQDYWDWAADTRAGLIARTEVSRTSAAAEVDTFGNNGIDTLVFSGDVSDDRPGDTDCNDYLDVEFSIDEAAGLLPLHPGETHYWLPVFPDGWEVPASPWIGGAQNAIADMLAS